MRNGVELYRSTPVTNIEKIDGGWQLTTPNGSFAARYVVNAAGLNAQAIHEMAAPHTLRWNLPAGNTICWTKAKATA